MAAQSAFVEHETGEPSAALAPLGPFGTVGMPVLACLGVGVACPSSSGGGGVVVTGGGVIVAVAGRHDARGTYLCLLRIFVVGIAFAGVSVGRVVGRGRRCSDVAVCIYGDEYC